MLIDIDGYDHYATADFLKKYSATSGTPQILASSGRRSSGCLETAGSDQVSKTLSASYATLVFGVAIRPSLLPASSAPTIIRFTDAAAAQLELRYNLDGTLSVLRAGTALGTSAATLPAGSLSYLEFKFTVHNSTGSYEVRINGVNVLSASGVDTQSTANATVNGFSTGYSNSQASSILLWDDRYLCDSSGSVNNDFLGDSRVDTLYPDGDGNYTQFTPSTGSSHFVLVDESPPNTTDYNESATVGDRDSYTLGNLTALVAETVRGVQVNAAVLKDDAGTRSASTFVRSGGVNGDGASVALSVSQGYLSQIYETNPDGGVAWTAAAINAMEAGLRVTA